ncbi:Ger(x)C family spore germination protein [Serpentinicella alkaliphila]|uniref:Spore germination protein KC n=1 Tax=Serpentinicella alkaliphila TaxID=1734049 RepID=A0A4R2TVG1_9FIRM|nr:Ger(x)C family spore germination protein [Serpentinicella alkaliphila]QUH25255.1 Ger(x)C family spore germination protein [Serpentinicella alkaliphila]TCQ07066.1 spore germination protein KC [Serpentinicella alkaliphila]
MKKFLIILTTVLFTTSLTSCWSRREINNLGFVIGLGISKTDAGLYSVVAQLANPRSIAAEGVTGKEIYTTIGSKGLTIFDALRNMSKIAKRRLYIGHIKSLVIDEKIAKEGLGEVVSFFAQDMEVRLEMIVLVTNDPPEKIYDTPNFVGIVPALGLSIIAENFGANNKIYVADMHETVEAVNNPFINYVTTLVTIVSPPTELEKPELILSRIAIFDSDKLVGYLDYEEGQAYNLVTNNFKNGLIVFDYALNNDKITIEGLESKADIKPKYENGKIRFDIELNVKGNVAERVSTEDLPHELDIEILQRQLNKVLADKINKAIVNAQKGYGVDYFNLSGYFFREYPKEFKEIKDNWNDAFSSATINVTVNSTIIHSALNLNRGRI